MANQFLIKNTMADMRALSATEITGLTNGTYSGVHLLGYYQAGDTPDPLVYLFSTTNDADNGGSIIATGGIKLVHQFSESVDVSYFGAKGDDIVDDTLPIQAALDLGLGINFRKGKIYRIKSYNPNGAPNVTDHLTNAGGISIPSNTVVNGNGATLKAITANHNAYNIIRIVNKDNIIVSNLFLEGDSTTRTSTTGQWGYGIAIMGSRNITIENTQSKWMWGDGFNLQVLAPSSFPVPVLTSCENITINNCVCDSNKRQGLSIESGFDIKVLNSRFFNTDGIPPQSGIDVEPKNGDIPVERVVIENCTFSGNTNAGLFIHSKNNNIKNVKVNKCSFAKGYSGITTELSPSEVIVSDCTFASDLARALSIRGGANMMFTNNIMDSYVIINEDADGETVETKSITFANNKLNRGISGNSRCRLLRIINNEIQAPNSIALFINSVENEILYNKIYNANTAISKGNDTNVMLVKGNVIKGVDIGISGKTNINIFENTFVNIGVNLATASYGQCISLRLGTYNNQIANNIMYLSNVENNGVDMNAAVFLGTLFLKFDYNSSQYNNHIYVDKNNISKQSTITKNILYVEQDTIVGNLARRQMLIKDTKGYIIVSSSTQSPIGTQLNDILIDNNRDLYLVTTAPVITGANGALTIVTEAVVKKIN